MDVLETDKKRMGSVSPLHRHINYQHCYTTFRWKQQHDAVTAM
jgi:hypothetical protein